jgi:ribosomal silencing factor RsfS
VAHAFIPEMREFYGLEYLWQDAPRINWKGWSRPLKCVFV